MRLGAGGGDPSCVALKKIQGPQTGGKPLHSEKSLNGRGGGPLWGGKGWPEWG